MLLRAGQQRVGQRVLARAVANYKDAAGVVHGGGLYRARYNPRMLRIYIIVALVLLPSLALAAPTAYNSKLEKSIAIIEEGRSKEDPALVPRANRVFGNIVAWSDKAAIVLPAGLLGNSSDSNLFLVARDKPRFSLGWGSLESPVRQGLAWARSPG